MGLYNNYYFFCKSIPLSGIFIHLNLYNIMKRTIKTIFLALCYSAVTNGQTSTPIHLPAIFSDHMVLQQKSTVSIWGWTLENKNSYLWARRSVHPANIHRQQKRKQNNTERYPIGRSMVM